VVERSIGFTLLVSLPDGLHARIVSPALLERIQTLPEALRHSLG
jgi:transposase, IS30 family